MVSSFQIGTPTQRSLSMEGFKNLCYPNHPSLMIQALWNFAMVRCHLYWRVVVRVECSAGSALLPPPPTAATAASTATACTKLLHIIFQRPGPRSRAPPAWPQPAPPPSHAAFSTQLLSQAGLGRRLENVWNCPNVQVSIRCAKMGSYREGK